MPASAAPRALTFLILLQILAVRPAAASDCGSSLKILAPDADAAYFGEYLDADGPHGIILARGPERAFQIDLFRGEIVRELLPPAGGDVEAFDRIVNVKGSRAILGGMEGAGVPSSLVSYDLDTGLPGIRIEHPEPFGAFSDAALTGAGTVVGVGSYSNWSTSVYEFNLNTGQILNQWLTQDYGVGGPTAVVTAGTLAVVGRPQSQLFGNSAGAVDIYDLATGLWVRTLGPAVPDTGAFFGSSLATDGQVLAVGRASSGVEHSEPGEMLVELFDLATGTRLDVLTFDRPCAAYPSGVPDLDIAGSTLLVSIDQGRNGASYDDCTMSGLVHLYDLQTGGLRRRILAPDPRNLNAFGWKAAFGGGGLLVGAPVDSTAPSPGAAYILSVGPGFEEMRPLTAGTQDFFGGAVAVDGALAVAAARGDDDFGLNSGSVAVFDTHAGLYDMLYSPLPDPGDFLGDAVAVSGSTVVAGCRLDGAAALEGGAVFVFDAATGLALHVLTAADAAPYDRLGNAVAVSGDLVVAGAEEDDDLGARSGAAYVFHAGTGAQLHKLLPADGAADDRFGTSVAVDGDRILVGASFHDGNGNNAGAAYVFDAATGQQLFDLVPSDAGPADHFGCSVALSGGLALVGALEVDGAQINAGAAYVFDVATGQQLHKLTAPVEEYFAYFGRAVALDDGIAVVGASHAGDTRGAAYVFDAVAGTLITRLEPTATLEYDTYFGWSVGVSGCTAVVGAFRADAPLSESGLAYLFDLSQDAVVSAPAAPSPALARLAPAAPNPFNPRTTLSFEMPRAGRAELAVFDVAGRRVTTLVDGFMEAGPHQAVWTGRDDAGREMGAGVYFARLATPQGVETGKLVLLK